MLPRIMLHFRRSGQRAPLIRIGRMKYNVKEEEGEHKKNGDDPEILSHATFSSLLLRHSCPSKVFYWIPLCSAIPCFLSNDFLYEKVQGKMHKIMRSAW